MRIERVENKKGGKRMAETIRAFGTLGGGAQILVVVMVIAVAAVVESVMGNFFRFLTECCRSYRQYQHRPSEKSLKKGEK